MDFFQLIADLAANNSKNESSRPSNAMCTELCPRTLSSTRGMVGMIKIQRKKVAQLPHNFFAFSTMKCVMPLTSLRKLRAQVLVNHFMKEETFGFVIASHH